MKEDLPKEYTEQKWVEIPGGGGKACSWLEMEESSKVDRSGGQTDRIRDYYLLRSITQFAVHAVPYRRGSVGLVTGHTGGRTASGRQELEMRKIKRKEKNI